MVSKTTRLTELPFDPHVKGGYYYHPEWDMDPQLIIKERGRLWCWWHWHIKRFVKPAYPKNIQRSLKYWWQRRTRGFDDREMWDLFSHLARHILPRLKEFRRRADDPNVMSGYPIELSPCYNHPCTQCGGSDESIRHDDDAGFEAWFQMLDDMIYYFECLVLSETGNYDIFFQANHERMKRGKQYFADFFESLWE